MQQLLRALRYSNHIAFAFQAAGKHVPVHFIVIYNEQPAREGIHADFHASSGFSYFSHSRPNSTGFVSKSSQPASRICGIIDFSESSQIRLSSGPNCFRVQNYLIGAHVLLSSFVAVPFPRPLSFLGEAPRREAANALGSVAAEERVSRCFSIRTARRSRSTGLIR